VRVASWKWVQGNVPEAGRPRHPECYTPPKPACEYCLSRKPNLCRVRADSREGLRPDAAAGSRGRLRPHALYGQVRHSRPSRCCPEIALAKLREDARLKRSALSVGGSHWHWRGLNPPKWSLAQGLLVRRIGGIGRNVLQGLGWQVPRCDRRCRSQSSPERNGREASADPFGQSREVQGRYWCPYLGT